MSVRLKSKISSYVSGRNSVSLRELIEYLNDDKRIYGTRKVAGNLVSLGWRQKVRESDIYMKRY